jgi:hypothetical protein
VLSGDFTLASRKTQHEFQTVLARSWTDTLQAPGQEMNFYMAQRWQNRWMSYELSYADIGKNFIAQSGFIRQTNIRALNASVGFNPLIRKYGVRSIFSQTDINYTANRSGNFNAPERWNVGQQVTFELEQGIWLVPGYTRSFDTLTGTANKKIADVHFVPGKYTFEQAFLFFFTNRANVISGNGSITAGKFYSADLRSISLTGRYAPNARFLFETTLAETRIDRPDRNGLSASQFDFNRRLIQRYRVSYSFTPNLAVSGFIQLNADKRRPQDAFHLNTITMNALLAYRSPYGHSFFLALNQFYDDTLDTVSGFNPFDRIPRRLRDQTIVGKMSYLFNL